MFEWLKNIFHLGNDHQDDLVEKQNESPVADSEPDAGKKYAQGSPGHHDDGDGD